ncbi:MAG: HNH endonuclease signature motif containing protein [Parabacteroides merdae]
MSNTYIPKSVQHEVWWKAAGRCEFKGCNKPLYKHGVTLDECKISELAHIIGDSENGPRGDKKLSKVLAKDPKNIMLMCPECHKYIDNEGKDKYTAEMLFDMKKGMKTELLD